jgi:dTDP-4-dehydrorhamnose reductase
MKKKSKKKDSRKTIVIFGASSFVGSNIAESFAQDYRVIGTYKDTPVRIPGVLMMKCDVLEKPHIQQILYTFKPDFTIYCVGLTSIRDCKEFPKVADALNTAGVFNVSMYSERYGSKFIYISNGYVFSGEKGQTYLENDLPMPSCGYGSTVAQSEFYIQKSCLSYLIFRTSNLYGRSVNIQARSWFEQLEYQSAENDKLVCDGLVHTGYLDIQLFIFVLKKCLDLKISNRLLHVSSSDLCTRYEFAQYYAEAFGQNKSVFVKGSWNFPLDTSMFSGNLDDSLHFKLDTMNLQRSIGAVMPTVKDSLGFTFRRFSSKVENKTGKKKFSGLTYI